MSHPHSVVNFSLLTVSQPGQSMHANAFPNLGFRNKLPLDLNFVQRLSQGHLTIQNDVGLDLLHDEMEFDDGSGSHQDFELKVVPDLAISTVAVGRSSPSKASRSRCHWTHAEIMVLFDAKKAQADKCCLNGKAMKKGVRSSHERWDEVAEHCKALGVSKLASQCKDKWERIWPSFRKIFEWERQLSPGKSSFWAMGSDERERVGFPRIFDKELYDAMVNRFGYIRNYDLVSILLDSSFDDTVTSSGMAANIVAITRVDMSPDTAGGLLSNVAAKTVCDEGAHDAAAVSCIEPSQNVIRVTEETLAVTEHQAPPASAGRRRQNIVRQIPVPLKVMGKKRAVCVTDASKENACFAKDPQSKNRIAHVSDHKLSLEERKLDLAEKRLLLEERKLEVTIEIGRGLVTSMERMTSAISAFGVVPAASH